MLKYSGMFPKHFILLYFLILLRTPQSAKWHIYLIYDTTDRYSDSQNVQNENDF